MTESAFERIMRTLAEIVSAGRWDRLSEVYDDDAVIEYPQSGEVFRGIANIRAQFENYPGMEPGTSELAEIVGGTRYALTPTYNLITLDGTDDKGTAVVRVRYPDGSWWWVLNINELRDGRVTRSRSFFAPDFEAPDWRAPYREPPKG